MIPPGRDPVPVPTEAAACDATRAALGATSVYHPGPRWDDDLPFQEQEGFPETLALWKEWVAAGRLRVHGVPAGRPDALVVSWRGRDRDEAAALAESVGMVGNGVLLVETVAGLPST